MPDEMSSRDAARPTGRPRVLMAQRQQRVRRALLALVFSWFFIGGIAHFALTDTEMTIIPPWLPNHRLLVIVSGVFELLGAFGLLFVRARAAAGWGLVMLTAAVTPANIYMWQHAADYPAVPQWLLALRLPFQAALMVGIWWSTRPVAGIQRPSIKTASAPPSNGRAVRRALSDGRSSQ